MSARSTRSTILSNAAAVIAEGEVMQLAAAKNTDDDRGRVPRDHQRQDGGAVLGRRRGGRRNRRRPAAEQAALRSYGTNLGIAFQLVDDALDYSGDSGELGKSVGDDFREGKITLPVILCLPARRRRRARVLESHARRGPHRGRRPRAGDRADEAHNAIEATLERARHYGAHRARRAGASFAATPKKQRA